jgi:hypothetical protein
MDRRKAYDRDSGPARWTALRVSKGTKEEEARRRLEQAQSLAASEQYHAAIELLRQSVFLAATAEAVSLLGLLLAKNPQWLQEAVDTLERAQEMGSTDPAVPAALKELRETLKSKPVEEAVKPTPPIPFRKPKRG